MLAPGASAYTIARPTGLCASTGRAIAVGERFMATLVEVDGEQELLRVDFGREAWDRGDRPAAGRIFAAWSSVMVEPNSKKKLLLGDEELIDIFEQMRGATDRRQQVFRYLLTLALMRRRMLKYEGSRGSTMLVRRRTLAGAPEAELLEVLDPGMDEAAIGEAMEELAKVIPFDEPTVGPAGAAGAAGASSGAGAVGGVGDVGGGA